MPPEARTHSFDASVLKVVSPETVVAWNTVLPILPSGSYLAGGTAIAVHLLHRTSRDLDFFTSQPLDAPDLVDSLYRIGYAPAYEDPSQIKGHLGPIRVDVTDASAVRLLRPLEQLEEGSIASVQDLDAMKLFAITHRLEQRDFFDVRSIEVTGGIRLEEGVDLFLDKYQPPVTSQAVAALLRRLALVSSVVDDPLLPPSRVDLVDFFDRRVPEALQAVASQVSPPRQI